MSEQDDRKPEEPAAHEEPAPAEPRKKKKKKKAKPKSASAPASDEKKPEAPRPGAGTPEGDVLRRGERAFDIGDYVLVRQLCKELDGASDPAVRDAARELAARLSIDPVQIVIVLACAAVLATIVYVWVF